MSARCLLPVSVGSPAAGFRSQTVGSTTAPPTHEAVIIDTVLGLIADAIWADFTGRNDGHGRIPPGTEPCTSTACVEAGQKAGGTR